MTRGRGGASSVLSLSIEKMDRDNEGGVLAASDVVAPAPAPAPEIVDLTASSDDDVDPVPNNHIPINHADLGGVVEAIEVQNSSILSVNGTYQRCRRGESDGVSKFVKPGPTTRQEHLIFRGSADSVWRIAIVDEEVISYYVSENSNQQSMDPNVPPRTGWRPEPADRFVAVAGNHLGLVVFAAVVDLQSSPLQMGRYEVTTQSHVEDETCVTCLEQFKDGELRSKLDCGHRLHRRCLDGMIINVIDRCPFCRSYL